MDVGGRSALEAIEFGVEKRIRYLARLSNAACPKTMQATKSEMILQQRSGIMPSEPVCKTRETMEGGDDT